jgi:hypothetical protein
MLRAVCGLTLIAALSPEAVGGQGGTPACAAASQGFLYAVVVRPLVIRGTVVRLWSDPAGPVEWQDWSTVVVNEVLKGDFKRANINILGHIGKEGREYLLALPDVGTPFLHRRVNGSNDCAVYILEVNRESVSGHIDSLVTVSSAPLSRIRAALNTRSQYQPDANRAQ